MGEVMRYTLHLGDCRDVMASMEADSIDAIVSDPPYGLSFMGKGWDHGVPGVEFWREALRVLKPGGHVLAFGGTRTFHRLAVGIEDAGFEIRDCLSWMYGSGFPKSLDVSKAMDKQRHDRAQVYAVTAWIRSARDAAGITNGDIDRAFGFHGMAGHWTSAASQPSVPTLDQIPRLLDVLGIDGDDVPAAIRALIYDLNGRKGQPGDAWFQREVIGVGKSGKTAIWNENGLPSLGNYTITTAATDLAKQWEGWGTALKPSWEPVIMARKPLQGTVASNVAEWGTGAVNIDGCRVAYEGKPPTGSGNDNNLINGHRNGNGGNTTSTLGRWPANTILDEEAAALLDAQSGVSQSKSTARNNKTHDNFFPGKKPIQTYGHDDSGGASRFFYVAKASAREREAGLDDRNHHPTVKPIALMRYLVRMVTPPDGVVLDPFMGSGSTGCAAMVEGMRFVGIDITPEYVEIARRRIAHHAAQGTLPI